MKAQGKKKTGSLALQTLSKPKIKQNKETKEIYWKQKQKNDIWYVLMIWYASTDRLSLSFLINPAVDEKHLYSCLSE